MYAWHCHVRQRLGAASVYLVIYAAISFLHLLKIKSLGGGPKAHKPAVSRDRWPRPLWSPHKKCICISLTQSDHDAAQRPPEISHQPQQTAVKVSLAPSRSVSSPDGRALPHEEGLVELFPHGEGKLTLTHKHIFPPPPEEAPRASWKAATILSFSH